MQITRHTSRTSKTLTLRSNKITPTLQGGEASTLLVGHAGDLADYRVHFDQGDLLMLRRIVAHLEAEGDAS